jgi:hypothetical protein
MSHGRGSDLSPDRKEGVFSKCETVFAKLCTKVAYR